VVSAIFTLVKKSISLFFIAWLVLSACDSQQRTIEELKGHWHPVHAPHYSYTLDINDSVVTLNQYSLIEHSSSFSLFDSVDHATVLPVPCGCGDSTLPAIRKFEIINDTLIYDEKTLDACYAFKPLKFVKGNPESCQWTHALSGNTSPLALRTFPMQTSSFVAFDSVRRNSVIVPLLVGIPENTEEWGAAPRVQVNDIFAAPKEIPGLINQIEIASSLPVSVCLVIDTTVPTTFINELKKQIPDRLAAHTFRLVSSSDGRLGYEKNETY
jgi:hypothetical protein